MYEMLTIDDLLADDLEDSYNDEDNIPEYCADIMDTYDLEEEVMENELPTVLRDVVMTLTPREQFVIFLHYGFITIKPVTFKDIGKLLGIRPDHISQIHAKALRKLRHPKRSRKIRSWLED